MPRDRYDRAFGHRHRRGHPVQQQWAGRGEYGAAYEAPYTPYEEEYRVPEPGRPRRGGYAREERGRRIRFHGYGMGYGGGARRSRGSYAAGQLRSGLNPRDEFEFRWGDGYVGGRGYGGTNYDYAHGYRTSAGGRGRAGRARPSEPVEGERAGAARPERPASRERGRDRDREAIPPRGEPPRAAGGGGAPRPSPATRGGYTWGEAAQGPELQGPARYGYGPYHERLKRRRRSDDDIRTDVQESLFYDTWVDVDRIAVEVEDGIVKLSGTLPDFNEVRYATDDAWDVDGVRGVHTELEVEPAGESGRLGHRREYGPGDVAEANAQRGAGRTGRATEQRGERGGAARSARPAGPRRRERPKGKEHQGRRDRPKQARAGGTERSASEPSSPTGRTRSGEANPGEAGADES